MEQNPNDAGSKCVILSPSERRFSAADQSRFSSLEPRLQIWRKHFLLPLLHFAVIVEKHVGWSSITSAVSSTTIQLLSTLPALCLQHTNLSCGFFWPQVQADTDYGGRGSYFLTHYKQINYYWSACNVSHYRDHKENSSHESADKSLFAR